MLAQVKIVVKEDNLLSNTSGVDENVDSAVVSGNILDSLLNGSLVTDVDLVEADVDTSLSGEVLSGLLAELLLNIKDGNALDANLREGLSHVVTESAATAVNSISRV